MAQEYDLQSSPNRFSKTENRFTTFGTWTPELSCSTAGDLNVPAGTQRGFYLRFYEIVDVWFQFEVGSIMHSTASGFWHLKTLPFPSLPFNSGNLNAVGTGIVGGVTVSSNNLITPYINAGTSFISFQYSNLAGGSVQALAVSHMPSGSFPQMNGHVRYITSAY